MTPIIRTVCGDIEPATLGHAQTHEHLLCSLAKMLPPTNSNEEILARHAPLNLGNYYETRRNHHLLDDVELLDVDDAVEAISIYRDAGGGAVVEASSRGLGRQPLGLREISERTGVHVIMGSGYYVRQFHPPALDEMTEVAIAKEIIDDITIGSDGTDVRSGVIGEIGMSSPSHPTEVRVLRAAARAQRETGAALLIHPGRDPNAPLDALSIVADAGGAPERTIMSHVDRTLFDKVSIRKLADTGCYVEFDLFGQENSHYCYGETDIPNDAQRIDRIKELIASGFQSKVLVAQDICYKTKLRKYGGEGYSHILEHVLPQMRRKGMSESAIHAITIDNPARALSFVA